MTVEYEFASYILDLERRVERLKSLEQAPAAAGGAGWFFITSTELAVAATSIVFSGIDQGYDDLMIIWRARSADLGVPNREHFCAQFNGDTTLGNYDTAMNFGNSGGTCYKDIGYCIIGDIIQAGATGDADDFSHGITYIPEYTNTAIKLTVQGMQGSYGHTAVFGYNGQNAGGWSKSGYPAVTSIKFYTVTNSNLLADTMIELYGLIR